MVLPKILKRLLAAAAAVVLLLIALSAGILGIAVSERGTAFLGRQVQQQLGDSVQWQALGGSLLGRMTLSGITVNQPGLEARIEHAELDWSPAALLRGELRIENAEFSAITVASSDAADAPEAEPFRPGSLPLPLDVRIEQLDIRDVQLQSDDGPARQIDQLALRADIVDRVLRIHALRLDAPEGRFELRGTVELRDLMALNIAADWAMPESTVDGGSKALSGTLASEGEVHWQEKRQFDLAVKATTNGLQSINADLPDQLGISLQVAGSQLDTRAVLDRLDLSLQDFPLAISASGEVRDIDQPAPAFDLELGWRKLRWPLAGDSTLVASESGELLLSGTVENYEVTATADLSGADIPPGHWQLRGRGNSQRLDIAALVGEVLDGAVSLSGPVSWQPSIQWSLLAEASELDISSMTDALTAPLSLSLASSGQLDADGTVDAGLTLHSVTSELAGIPVTASALANIRGERIELAALRAQAEGNTLDARGHVLGNSLDLQWQVQAPNPGALLPGAGGTLSASGELGGLLAAPELTAAVRAKDLHWEALRLASLELDLSAGSALQSPLAIDLHSAALSNDGELLARALALQAQGTLEAHQLKLQAQTAGETLALELSGGLMEDLASWRGALTALQLDSKQLGGWRLRHGGALLLSAQQLSLGESCLTQDSGNAGLCAEGGWQAQGRSRMQARLENFALQDIVESVSGSLSLDLDASLDEKGALRGRGDIALTPGTVQVSTAKGVRQLAYDGGEVKVRIAETGLQADTALGLPEQGRVSGRISLPQANSWPLPAQQSLAGSLQASIPELEGLAALVPQVSALTGRLDGKVELAGSLQRPDISGDISLRDGSVDVPLAGLALRQLNLLASTRPGSTGELDLRGSAVSGDGTLQLSGTANLATLVAELQVQGNEVTVFNTADAQVAISPDLAIAWRDDTLTLRGDIRVPRAAITPQLQLSPAALAASPQQEVAPGQRVTASADVVVINRKVKPPPERYTSAAPFRIDSQVRLVLGEAVNIDAVGFRSHISGAVTFTNTPDQADVIPRAQGRLALEGGTFRAFGQDLEIENGQIIFADVPATEPELNLRAVRWIDNDPQVTAAGVSITGTLQEPQLELFSRPQLPTSEVQSYLLTGRSPRSRDNVLSLGTYISPRIYVGYGYNMVQDTSQFNSLFTITPRFGLSANVGEADNNINATFTYER